MENQFEWQMATPESQGMDNTKLESLWQELERRDTKAFLVARHDHIVFEKYARGHDAKKKHYTASMAKALVGGMSLILAMDEGLIDPDDLVCKYVPQWKDDPLKSKIMVKHLATHTSGMEDAEHETLGHMEIPGWKGDFWRQAPDPFTVSRDHAEILFEPGTGEQYSNPGMAMLSYAITVALQNSPHKDVRTLLRERVMKPIGVPDDEWSIGYEKTFEVDTFPLVANWGGGGYTARATALVNRLMLRKGNWEGEQLIKTETIEWALKHTGLPNWSGLSWWINSDNKGGKRFPKFAEDAFWGAGAGNQIGGAILSLDLVFVRNGKLIDKKDFSGGLEKHLFNPLMDTVKE